MFAKKTKPFILLVAALCIITSSSAYAQSLREDRGDKPPMQDRPPEHKPMIPDLTDAQREKMETLHIELMERVTPLQNEIGEKEAQLHTLQTSDKVSMPEINRTIDEIGNLKTKIMKLTAQTHQEIRELLTDEQRVLFDARPPHHGGPDQKGPPLEKGPR